MNSGDTRGISFREVTPVYRSSHQTFLQIQHEININNQDEVETIICSCFLYENRRNVELESCDVMWQSERNFWRK